MRFCKRGWILALIASLHLTPIVVAEEIMTSDAAIKMAKEKGWLEGLDLSGSQKATSKDVQEFLDHAQHQMKEITINEIKPEGEMARPDSVTFMFVSLSMPRASIIDAFKNAARAGVTVYINGMFEGDKNIMDTMARLHAMTQELVIKPTVKFGPTWFKKYNIQRVPALVYDNGRYQSKMAGMTQMSFFNDKLSTVKHGKDFGAYGATFPVEEPSLIEQLRKRMAQIDWQQKAANATKNYWKNRPRFNLDPAIKDDVFYIDPTISVKKDIVNRRGVVLAKAGTRLNPFQAIPNAYLGLYIIDATDTNQLKWLDKMVGEFDYRDQIIISHLDPEKGWDSLSALRKRYKREIFVLEQELINKFSIRALPSKVSVEQAHIKVNEYFLGDQQ
ncbi:hypothetical protein TUM3794_20080 [Shewanella colwelliana]|uniref:Conjugal transfer protein n=1 Tax=Shewanella colwelliana TaxID=23 RepID=A0ABQ4P0I6_SHECO|nr:TrbC family F-type conjugative pilus assembly protein [Shewanella colwelliana]GIU40934.1 hypothetical protein TUM3794_20080 [Shewanella colwelliana]